ncbi:MAG TPA: enolase C-terminal domain-like protein [Anaeromyxobacteraceae bacterium]|nr:enolase C-terminal domain-like protein [Anaeromyxobacteraceae bacterium]
MTAPLTLRSIEARGVDVPMKHVLGTSQAALRKAPLLLVDVTTEEGVTGRSYVFCYRHAAAPAIGSLLGDIQAALRGERVAPVELSAKLARHFTLLGASGPVRMAISAFDAACWDALAIAAGMPLASLLGGAPRPIRAYNSNGLGLIPLDALERETDELLEGGFRAVKLRLGHPTLEADLAAVRAVRGRLPPGVSLMVDYNQALSATEAARRGRALDGEGVHWIEEPIRHDDLRGCAHVTREVATPVQIGENFTMQEMVDALALRACDLVMPDLCRIGGVTGWLTAASLASAHGIPMSSHLYPELSAHLLAVTPTCDWLEYVDWADAIVNEPLRILDGNAVVPERPGAGLTWNEEAVARYRFC